jgi:hypothetical protein
MSARLKGLMEQMRGGVLAEMAMDSPGYHNQKVHNSWEAIRSTLDRLRGRASKDLMDEMRRLERAVNTILAKHGSKGVSGIDKVLGRKIRVKHIRAMEAAIQAIAELREVVTEALESVR